MAEVRSGDWGSEPYWRERIAQYLSGELTPREGTPARIAFVCADGGRVVGLIAGHLTRRHGCDGELEWISVRPEHRRRNRPDAVHAGAAAGIASGLLRRLAEWFLAHGARRVCVDVEPANRAARRFYARHGAHDLKPHWMVWEDIGTAREGGDKPSLPTAP